MSAIVAALAVTTSAALTGCGQRGPLYLPSVPPLPEKPAARDAQAPITLAPADSLGTAPKAGSEAAPAAASSPAPDQ